MTTHTPDALASALPAGVYDTRHDRDVRQIAAFQAERLAESGYVLIHTAPDEATVERLARAITAQWHEVKGSPLGQARAVLAALGLPEVERRDPDGGQGEAVRADG